MGIQQPSEGTAVPKHRLVVLGDSLSQGFQSFAIYNTSISYPALVAAKLGLSGKQFIYPTYTRLVGSPDYMGPALNLEYMARFAGDDDCNARTPVELVELAINALKIALEIHVHWDSKARIDELGLGQVTDQVDIVHNLAVAGFDVGDLTQRTADIDRATLNRWAEFTDIGPVATNARALISLPVLKTARRNGRFMSTVEAAKELGDDGGIETLIVFIGANNALGTVLTMDIRESGRGYDLPATKGQYNLWRPAHFKIEFDKLTGLLGKISAKHVLFGTVPHVTAAPLAHGVKGRSDANPQFFKFYTYPWVSESHFDPKHDPKLTCAQAMHIDDYIDSYNQTIAATVKQASDAGLSWHVVDLCKLMDSFAFHRYWDPDEPRLENVRRAKGITAQDYASALPPVLQQLTAKGRLQPSADDPIRPPDSRFFRSDGTGRLEGGLVALDGVHPSTISYGVIAQEFLNVMGDAGVNVGDGKIDFVDLVGKDSLISNPPNCVRPDLKGLGWGEVGWDWVAGLAKTLNKPHARHWRFTRQP